MENGPFIDVLPLKKCDFPYFLVCLPEGTSILGGKLIRLDSGLYGKLEEAPQVDHHFPHTIGVHPIFG